MGAGVLVGAVGAALVALWLRPAEPAPTPTPTVRPAPRTVCASASPAPDAGGGDAALRLRWCEARLAEKTREQPTARKDWPEALPDADQPDAWQEAIDRALAACAPPLDAELTDCEEYPCVAALRPRPGVDPYAASRALSACMGAHVGEELDEVAGAVVVQARCPDGREEPVVIVSAASEAGTATVLSPEEDHGLDGIVYLGMTMGRRAESALQLWACAEAPTP